MAHELQQAGWPKARALIGGFQAWVDTGLPVEPKTVVEETTSDE